jgi:hypothetical protein
MKKKKKISIFTIELVSLIKWDKYLRMCLVQEWIWRLVQKSRSGAIQERIFYVDSEPEKQSNLRLPFCSVLLTYRLESNRYVLSLTSPSLFPSRTMRQGLGDARPLRRCRRTVMVKSGAWHAFGSARCIVPSQPGGPTSSTSRSALPLLAMLLLRQAMGKKMEVQSWASCRASSWLGGLLARLLAKQFWMTAMDLKHKLVGDRSGARNSYPSTQKNGGSMKPTAAARVPASCCGGISAVGIHPPWRGDEQGERKKCVLQFCPFGARSTDRWVVVNGAKWF